MTVATRLARLARPAPAPAPAAADERCDLCGEAVAAVHRHVVDVSDRRLLCACRACALLLDRPGSGGGRLRLVPLRRRRLDGFALGDAAWASLQVPVDVAFFLHSGAADRVVAIYPGPMGATESLLGLEAWADLAAADPALAEMEPDVEALLVARARGLREHWIVPIDDCYELVGILRTGWRGFGGGPEVWRDVARFFDDLPTREERRW